MQLISKSILLISPEPWDHIFVSKHHYATHLGERGNKVYFLNPPSHKKAIKKANFKNVWEVNYKGFPRGLRFFPSFLQKYCIKKSFQQLQRLCKVEFDIIWSFDNSVFYDFSALPKNVLKISHIVDLNQDFQTAKATSTADICFGVIQPIVNRLKKYNNKTFLIPHGVQKFPPPSSYLKLPGNNRIKALYIGNLSMPFIDWEILLKTVSNHPTLDFVFIGSGGEHIINTKTIWSQKENVYFLKRINADDIPQYLSQADILILTYLPQYSKEFATPHKMMEYLASGKMIVATYTDNYKKIVEEGLFLMSKKNEEFVPLFNEVLNNLSYWNSKEKQKLRKTVASENTYDKQINRIQKYIHLC